MPSATLHACVEGHTERGQCSLRHTVIMRLRLASLALLPVIALLAGCFGAEDPESLTAQAPSVRTTLQCDNKLRNVGEPDYLIPDAPNTAPPIDQAMRFAESSHLRRDYPDLEIVLADQQATSQLFVLVSDDKTVGTLVYETNQELGWHLTSMEQCSPTEPTTEQDSIIGAPMGPKECGYSVRWDERKYRLYTAEPDLPLTESGKSIGLVGLPNCTDMPPFETLNKAAAAPAWRVRGLHSEQAILVEFNGARYVYTVPGLVVET